MNISTVNEQDPATFWIRNANCLGKNPEIFFESENKENEAQAKRICAECVVRGECLVYALLTEQKGYIWGGMTTDERANITEILPRLVK